MMHWTVSGTNTLSDYWANSTQLKFIKNR